VDHVLGTHNEPRAALESHDKANHRERDAELSGLLRAQANL